MRLINFLPFLAIIIVFILVGLIQLVLFQRYAFQCSNCQNVFRPSIAEAVLSPHIFTKKLLRCPKCQKLNWCSWVAVN